MWRAGRLDRLKNDDWKMREVFHRLIKSIQSLSTRR